jgi:vitamin B12 transporter
MRPLPYAALIATSVAGLPTAAQTPVIDLGEITVSAELVETTTDRTGATVSIVDAGAVARTGQTRLTEVLATVPGVSVLARGPIGTTTGLTVRGASQNYLKVLWDGIDIADPSGPQVAYDFGRLTTMGLGRVELLRGSQSALYGSQAVAGVLSLQSPRPEREGTTQTLALEGGSYRTLSGGWTFARKSGADELTLSLSQIRTSGFSAAAEADGNTEPDGYRAARIGLTGARGIGAGRIGFAAFAERTAGDYDEQFPVGDGSPDERSTATSRGLRVFAEATAWGFDHMLEASGFSIDRTLSGSTIYGASRQDYQGRRTRIGWEGKRDTTLGRLTLGADTTRESYGEASSWGASEGVARVSGVYGELGATIGATTDLALTLRHDEHSRFGGQTSGRIAAAHRLGAGTILRASAANGFRAPSGYELFGPYGAAALQPEKSRSVDLGIERSWQDDRMLRATLFRIETDNLIDYVYPSYLQIAGETRREGVEIEGTLPAGPAILRAAYTLTEGSNPPISAGNTWNSIYGRHQLALGLGADLGAGWQGDLGLRHVADRQTLPDYTVADATIRRFLSDGTEAYLRVENLFDADYQLWQGYGTSGRAFYVGLRRSF